MLQLNSKCLLMFIIEFNSTHIYAFLSSLKESNLPWFELQQSPTCAKMIKLLYIFMIVNSKILYISFVGKDSKCDRNSNAPNQRFSCVSLVKFEVKVSVFTNVCPSFNGRINFDSFGHVVLL